MKLFNNDEFSIYIKFCADYEKKFCNILCAVTVYLSIFVLAFIKIYFCFVYSALHLDMIVLSHNAYPCMQPRTHKKCVRQPTTHDFHSPSHALFFFFSVR